LSDLGWDGHLLLLHRTELERRSGLAAWVRRGLEREEKVVYTHFSDVSSLSYLHFALREQGVDVSKAAAEGRLAEVPVRELTRGSWQDALLERALADGFRSARLLADSASALCALSNRGGRQIPAMCQYDATTTTEHLLHDILSAHWTGVRERQLQTAPTPNGLAVAGELDASNDRVLTATLRAATGAAGAAFRLDLSGVRFLDASAGRALLLATERFRARGGVLVLAAARPNVEHVLGLLGVDQADNTTLSGSTP
jgi:anti-anti-sigma factor